MYTTRMHGTNVSTAMVFISYNAVHSIVTDEDLLVDW